MTSTLSESFSTMISISLSFLFAYILVNILSYAVGVSNTPLIHAKKRAIKLKTYTEKLKDYYSSKTINSGISIIHFKKLKKLRSQVKKSVLVYVYDDGRNQSDANDILSLFKTIDSATNKAILALVDQDYQSVEKMLSSIIDISDSAIGMLDELIKKENKEKVLNFI